MRFLFVSVLLLTALVVPVAAATFDSGADADTAAASSELPSTASATLLVERAPPPLIFMALGTLLVVAMIGRRARRLSITPLS
ncbi:MAG: hypothetical protein ACYTG2_10905 [Planctomycetota bacterium]